MRGGHVVEIGPPFGSDPNAARSAGVLAHLTACAYWQIRHVGSAIFWVRPAGILGGVAADRDARTTTATANCGGGWPSGHAAAALRVARPHACGRPRPRRDPAGERMRHAGRLRPTHSAGTSGRRLPDLRRRPHGVDRHVADSAEDRHPGRIHHAYSPSFRCRISSRRPAPLPVPDPRAPARLNAFRVNEWPAADVCTPAASSSRRRLHVSRIRALAAQRCGRGERKIDAHRGNCRCPTRLTTSRSECCAPY